MPRCNDCAKFVSLGEPDVDDVVAEIHGDTLSLGGSMVLTCADCSGPVRTAELSADLNLADHFDPLGDGQEAEYDLSDQTSEATDRKEKGARGKRFYGVSIDCVIERVVLDADSNEVGRSEKTVTIAAEEQASSFEAY